MITLWQDPGVQTALHLGHARGRMLFELRPDLFPYGRLSAVETALWSRFYEELESG